MKKIILLLIAVFFSILVLAQKRYTITEEQLATLEKTVEDLKMRNEVLQKTLINLQFLQKRLKNKLKRKEVLLKSLKSSFNKYEKETANSINGLTLESEKLKIELNRTRRQLWISRAIIALGVIVTGTYLFYRKGFP